MYCDTKDRFGSGLRLKNRKKIKKNKNKKRRKTAHTENRDHQAINTNQIKFSPFSPAKTEQLTAGSDEIKKKQKNSSSVFVGGIQ